MCTCTSQPLFCSLNLLFGELLVAVTVVSCVKAMLHETIFLQLATQQTLRCKCMKKFTCNTPFCNCNCCVASFKKSRTTLYVSQRCEISCLRVTSSLQLATQFCQNGPIRAHLSQDVGDLGRPPSCLLLYALQVAKKVANV